MAEGEIAAAARPSRTLLLVSLVLWTVLTFALPLVALTLNAVRVAQFPLGYWVTAFWCLVLLAALALAFQRFHRGGKGNERSPGSLSVAGEALGAAGALGFVAAIAALGFDGLAYPLGLVAGLTLTAILVAPRLAQYPVNSLTEFFDRRFEGGSVARLATIAIIPATILLLAANVRGAALVIQALLGLDTAIALAVTAAGLAVFLLASFFTAMRGVLGIAVLFALIAIWLFFAATAIQLGRVPFSDLTGGTALVDLSAVDQKLIVGKLADFKSLRPMASPFFQMSSSSFAGIVFAMALGLAASPALLNQLVSTKLAMAGQSSRRAAYAAMFAAIVLVAAPALAVLLRLAFETAIAGQIKTAAIPQSLTDAASLGGMTVCGVQSNIADACAHLPGHKGVLRLQDIAFAGDGFVLAAAKIADVPAWAVLSFATAILFLSIAAARALLNVHMAGAPLKRQSLKKIALVILIISAAYTVAMFSEENIAALASEGFALAASSLFPALILGLYWRRMSRAGAIAAIGTGFALSFSYIGGTAVLHDNLFGFQTPAIALVAVPAGFLAGLIATVIASLVTKSPSENG